MRVLILGGMGFIGSHLVDNLVNSNYDVTIVSKSLNKKENVSGTREKIDILIGDITNFDWLKQTISTLRPDYIFHLAGQFTHYESFERPLYDVDVNTKTTLVILESMKEMEKKCRLIFGSTLWVVGRPVSLPIDEETPCSPLNIYAADRLASEHYCKIYNLVYDLDTIIMRLSNTYGPREQHDNPRKAALNYLLYKGYQGEDITIYGDGKFYKDYVYVTDVISAAEILMKKGKSGEVYFVGTNTPTWFYKIGEIIEEITEGRIVYVKPSDYHNRIDVGNIVVNNNKIKSLGWNWKISVREGLERTLNFYKEKFGNG